MSRRQDESFKVLQVFDDGTSVELFGGETLEEVLEKMDGKSGSGGRNNGQ